MVTHRGEARNPNLKIGENERWRLLQPWMDRNALPNSVSSAQSADDSLQIKTTMRILLPSYLINT
jgi:hypothetical protein